MAMRRSASYTKMKVVPYTRISKKKGKSYIKTVPPQKIVKFSMGSPALYREGKFPHQIILVAEEAAQIRNNAMEACRQYLHKKLEEELGGQYLFKVIPFPHHIQRENKMLTAPGADRMQTGMQLSFGKPLAKAALVKKGSPIFFFAVANEKAVFLVRDILNKVKPKLPCKTKVMYEMVKIAVV